MAKEFNFNNYDSVYGVDLVPPRRTGAKVAAITAAVLGVTAGGGAAAYNLSPLVKNQVKLRVSSPENYSAWVYAENTEDIAKQAADQYRAYTDRFNAGSSVDMTFKFEPSAEALDYAKNMGGKELEDVIADTTDIFFSVSASGKDGDVSGAIKLGRNSDTLTTMEFAMDQNPFDLFIRIPELSEKWLNVDQESMGGEFAKSNDLRPEDIISPEELETEVKRYTDLWNKYAGETAVEKSEDVVIDDITVGYTVISRTFTPEKINEFRNAVIDEMKNDELLRTIVVDRLKTFDSADEFNAELERGREAEAVDTTVELDTYVDPKGVIRGFRGLKGEEVCVDFVYGISGDQVRGKLVTEDANGTLSATQNGSKYTGNLKLAADGQEYTIDFTDYEQTSKDFGFFNADTVVKCAVDGEETMAVSVKFTGTPESETAVMNIKGDDGTDYGKFTVGINSKKGADVSVPDKSSAYYVDDDFDFEKYVTDEELKSYTSGLLEKIGISEKAAEDITGLFGGYGGYGGYSSDFDFEDYDFEDYDFEDYDFSDYDYEDFDFGDYRF